MDSRPPNPYPNRGGHYQPRGGHPGSVAYVSGSPPQQGTTAYPQNPTTGTPVGRGYQVQPGSSYSGSNTGLGGAQSGGSMYGQFQVPSGPMATAPGVNPMVTNAYGYQSSPYSQIPPIASGSRSVPYPPANQSAEVVGSNVVDVPHIEKTANGKFPCPLPGCQEEYKDKSSATRHYKTKHGGPQERCSVCSREFPRGDSMQRHLKSQHGVGK